MDVCIRIFFFMLIFIKICGCSACMTHRNQSKNVSREDIYANGMYKYSVDTNWTTDKLHSEVWFSENVPLALIEYAPFSRNSSAVVEQFFPGSIYLRRCLNLTYSATDEKYKEICIHFIVMGCTEGEQNNASNLHYLAVLVPIIGLACILGIEWKIGCFRRWFSHHRNGRRQPVDDQDMAEEDRETFCWLK